MVALTIGMATYNDFDGLYFTLPSMALSHRCKRKGRSNALSRIPW
jgi:hypothetical protein